jgi:ribose 5-phosphate isomerase RpiB
VRETNDDNHARVEEYIVRIGIGSDRSGVNFKEALKARFRGQSQTIEDVCTSDPAPGTHTATDRLASAIGRGRVDLAVLICSGAIGTSIRANEHRRVHAAFRHEASSGQRAVHDDNMNFLVLETQAVTNQFACKLADAFINASCISRNNAFDIPPCRLARVVERIGRNLDKPLKVSELSGLTQMTQSQFSKLFKHSTHFTTVFGSLVGMRPRQFQPSCRYGMAASHPKALPVLNHQQDGVFPRWLQREGGFNG